MKSPPPLRDVARAFVNLQSWRHTADYDNSVEWTQIEVETRIKTASQAFADWSAIRLHPMASNYLLAMLLGRPRP